MADQYARPTEDTEPDDAPDGRPPLPVIRWAEASERPAVVLLDQTRLPSEEAELACTDVPALVRAIQALAVRGAPLLGIAGAYGVALAAVRGDDVDKAADALADARPTAVNLARGARRAQEAYRAAVAAGGDAAQAAEACLAEARALHEHDAQSSARMALHGLTLLDELVPGGSHRVLTHCNTGALVSGGEGTAFAVALAAHRSGRLGTFWVDETRPLLQGARLTAYEAARHGMPYRVLTDNAAGALFAAGEVDAVLIGADRIAADGSVANKVGSYPLAVLAKYHHVPFVVVAPVSTVDLDTPDGDAIVVEQRSPTEVTEITVSRAAREGAGAVIPLAPSGSPAYNPAFDVTPPELVTAIVTEEGVASPVTAPALAELCAKAAGAAVR
ncbi:S-methyl-5-thioribose-1-phosphate isomerase [Streptomyces sp. TS71-3]|uniref:S-methyl-5-thioribose-1-phosphate isomerase n=1 Tax=Streptomyces sp. TS71-3 TaxID=2733862 RepID=UPI001B2911E7|nr:S-methyl-5-thioribose-1-phosphate isomerase [Streptomyces sp. TS71-3]GHJ36414.1 methylthioribose-1-phosphate isomerase [Streptomyces sp. TS71-3]